MFSVMGPRPPSGTLTFLFTDIEGSTTWWELDPDGMRVALARHDEILRSAIESAGGYLFTTAGDSFAAAFSSPVVAVDAALAAQRALDAEAWPASIELRVRMGLHTGTAITLARIPAGDLFTRVFLRQLDSMFSSYWGEPRMALKILDEIEPESQRLRNPLLLAQGAWVRMVALLDVEPAAAVDVGNVAVDAAKAIRALWVVDAVTNYLTSALAAAGDLDDAVQGVRVVLEHMADGGGVQSLANTARNGLLIFDRLGLPTEAATVVGWLTAHGSEMPGTAGMRQRATEVIQRVEANLDAKRFAVAASHGQTFNDRDLVDFMLQHLPGA